jgi:predicted ATPase/DNA-binding CsgD family transcriptional regulator
MLVQYGIPNAKPRERMPMSVTTPSTNLPPPLTPCVGREQEQARVHERLDDPSCRLLTLVGVGGVGKTCLALEVARALASAPDAEQRFPHGTFWVGLSALSASSAPDELLATSIASALGMPLSGPSTPSAQLRGFLRERRLLLLLDNCEHLPGIAAFIAGLLQDAPALTILATSRERLHVRGEHVFTLEGLAVPDDAQAADRASYESVRLFALAAAAVAPGFALGGEQLSAVVRVCQLVGGLPLAIELAASWMRVLNADEIANELAQSLDFLTATTYDLPERQRSLRAVFEHSWQLLDEGERRALRQLAVFRGSFTRTAAAAVFDADDRTTLALLANLVDKSLLRRAATPPEGVARYEMLELLRQYALEQLARANEQQAAAARHARFYVQALAAQLDDLRGPGQRAALTRIAEDIEQLRAAWGWATAAADAELIARAAPSLFHFYDMCSWFQEGAAAFGAARRALEPARAAPATAVAWARTLAWEGWFTFHLGRQSEAQALLEQSIAALRAAGERPPLVFPLNYLGAVCAYLGDYAATQRLCEEALALTDELGDRYGQAIACNILSQASFDQGDYQAAGEFATRSLALERALGNSWSMAYSLTNLGKVAFAQGQYPAARELFQQSMQIRRDLGDPRGVAICARQLGDTALALGLYEEALAHYEQSLKIAREIGNRWSMAAALTGFGRLALRAAQLPAATMLAREALRLALETESAPQAAGILELFAELVAERGDLPFARELRAASAGAETAIEPLRAPAARALAWLAPQGTDAALEPPGLEEALTMLRTAPAPAPAPAAAGARASGAKAGAQPASPPAGLTPREVEVLRLVAQGLTDREVAERLVLSPRTVSTHLTAIYGKLQVNTRSAATRFAVDHGLV